MSIDLKGGKGARVASALAAFALCLAPQVARAQDSCPNAVAVGTFYEVREDINCNPGNATDPACSTPAKGFGVRIADATLTGSLEGQTQFSGPTTIEASSILNQRDWTGPAHGKILLDNGTRATFSGQLNLAPAILGGTPLATIDGKWQGTKGTFQGGGTLSGTFLIPFQIPDHPEFGFFYLQLDPTTGQPTGGVVPLQPNEFASVGGVQVPLVKLLVTFCSK